VDVDSAARAFVGGARHGGLREFVFNVTWRDCPQLVEMSTLIYLCFRGN
jgi:hypothetical protein